MQGSVDIKRGAEFTFPDNSAIYITYGSLVGCVGISYKCGGEDFAMYQKEFKRLKNPTVTDIQGLDKYGEVVDDWSGNLTYFTAVF